MTDFSSVFPPKKTRMHEVCGPGAPFFAAILAGQIDEPFLWIRETWRGGQLNPSGFADFLSPDKLLVASVENHIEGLAAAEESLRSGAIPLVVLELSQPLDLTKGRRLQLSAKAGKSTALAIISEDMGSNAAETRWRCNPVYDPGDSTLQRWELIKNKSGTLGIWNVRWSATARRINVVSEAGL